MRAELCARARDVTDDRTRQRDLADVLQVITQAQHDFITGVTERELFDGMCSHPLRLATSERDQIGGVRWERGGAVSAVARPTLEVASRAESGAA